MGKFTNVKMFSGKNQLTKTWKSLKCNKKWFVASREKENCSNFDSTKIIFNEYKYLYMPRSNE